MSLSFRLTQQTWRGTANLNVRQNNTFDVGRFLKFAFCVLSETENCGKTLSRNVLFPSLLKLPLNHPIQNIINFFLASSQHWQVSYTNPHDIVICTNCPSLLCLPAWLFSINKWEKTSFGYKISFDTWHKKDEKPYLRKTFSSL